MTLNSKTKKMEQTPTSNPKAGKALGIAGIVLGIVPCYFLLFPV